MCDSADICPGGDDTIDGDGDGVPDDCDACPADFGDPPDGCPASGPLLETGALLGVSSDEWTTVALPNDYTSMVVVATPHYVNGDPPLVTRVTVDNANDSFDVRVDRADGNTGTVAADVYYVVVEEGDWTADHGFEAHTLLSTVTAQNNSWGNYDNVGYAGSYATPVVIGQVLSYNDPDHVVFFATGNSRSTPPNATLRVGKTVNEDPDNGHGDETIGWIVFDAGAQTIDGRDLVAGVGADSVRGPDNSSSGYTYSGIGGLGSASAAVVALAGIDGGNGGWAALYGSTPFTATSVTTVADEDQLRDSERRHTTEQVAYVLFD